MDKTENAARARKFETLFDGDEIDDKRYPLGGGVTGIDAATAEYLVRSGRLAEVDDERFGDLKDAYADDETADDADDETADEFATTAAADFTAGRIPDDLVNTDATGDDKLVSRKELDAIAKRESVETSSAMDKADVARAIMAARAKAIAS